MKDREAAVNLAIEANIPNQTHPEILPENIYGTDGDWEIYATPSRDARIKASVREGKKLLYKVIQSQFHSELKMTYKGLDLVSDLRDLYLKKSTQCLIKATKVRSLNLDKILMNLFALSFDPFHSAELRWGMVLTSQNRWYLAEQGLRNRIDRDYSMRTNYNVDDLPNAPVSQVELPDLSYDNILEIKR